MDYQPVTTTDEFADFTDAQRRFLDQTLRDQGVPKGVLSPEGCRSGVSMLAALAPRNIFLFLPPPRPEPARFGNRTPPISRKFWPTPRG